jgi:hypothetical protein
MRSINEIAREIRSDWKKIHYAAAPYLDAMGSLSTVQDQYGADDARGIVLYFLANAATYRGENAKRLKLELKQVCSIK